MDKTLIKRWFFWMGVGMSSLAGASVALVAVAPSKGMVGSLGIILSSVIILIGTAWLIATIEKSGED
jgi:hypothetical protein